MTTALPQTNVAIGISSDLGSFNKVMLQQDVALFREELKNGRKYRFEDDLNAL
ncbi:hypothetical protein ACFOHW_05460 [Paenibacillus abyssi]|uniref:hypothetical protein n=1 Tax=Paenibacillus abyssi TaxID=1340531 RepID=UPI0036163D08